MWRNTGAVEVAWQDAATVVEKCEYLPAVNMGEHFRSLGGIVTIDLGCRGQLRQQTFFVWSGQYRRPLVKTLFT